MSGNQTNGTFLFPDFHILEATSLFSLIFLSFLSLGTVIVNGFALFVVYRDPLKVFRTPLAVFLTGILASDFLTGLIVEPIFVFFYSQVFYPTLEEKELWQHIRSAQVLVAVTVNTSFLATLALAIIQLIAIKAPGFYLRFVSTRNALIGLAIIWTYAVFFSLIPDIFSISMDMFYAIDLILHPMALSIAMVVIYTITYCAFQRSARSYESTLDSMPQSVEQTKRAGGRTEAEREFLKGTLMLVVLLVVTVWPYSVVQGYSFHDHWNIPLMAVGSLTENVLFTKFFLDPFVFLLRLPKYRKASILVFREIREMLGLAPKSLPNASYHHTDEESSESDLGREPHVNLGSPSLTLQL